MALGDITIYADAAFGYPGDTAYAANGGSVGSINAGEPVSKPLNASTVGALATSKPVVGTDYLAGISSSTSTDTASAAGVVSVIKPTSGVTYLIAPKVAATWAGQTTYDSFVGRRVTFDLTSGVYTINSTDGSTNGLIVEPLDTTKFPNKVRFSIRAGALYTA